MFDSRAERNAAFAAWYLKGRLRGLFMLPLMLMLALFTGLLLLGRFAADPNKNLPLSEAALRQYEHTVPDEENAYIPLRAALKNRTGGEPNLSDPGDPATVAHWTCNQAVIQDIHAAFQRPRAQMGDGSLVFSGTKYLGFDEIEAATELLCLEARMRMQRNDSQQRDSEEGVRALSQLFRFARCLEEEPSIYRIWSALVPSESALDVCTAVLQEPNALNDAQLQALDRVLPQPRDVYLQLSDYIAFERSFYQFHMDQGYAGKAGPVFPIGPSGGVVYGSDRACLDGVFSEFVEHLREHKLPNLNEVFARHQRGPAPVTRMIIPNLERMEDFQCEDRLRLLRVAIAVRRYQLKHRSDPASLIDLIPEFLPALPEDAYGGDTLRLRVSVQGEKLAMESLSWTYGRKRTFRYGPNWLVLYAVGRNRRDEGGAHSKESDDMVILLPLCKSLSGVKR